MTKDDSEPASPQDNTEATPSGSPDDLTVTSTLATQPLAAPAAATLPTSGYCGDPNVNGGKNVQWSLDSAGTLTVWGSGATDSYSGSYYKVPYDNHATADDWIEKPRAPWAGPVINATGQIKKIVVKEGVTSLGTNLFSSCSATSISLPSSLTSIGLYAFAGCNKLQSIAIPRGLKEIKGGAFYQCSKLTSVSLPNTLAHIYEYAFQYTGLKSVKIPSSVVYIGTDAFPSDCKVDTSGASLIKTSRGDYGSDQYITKVQYQVTFDQSSARSMLQMVNDFRTGKDAWYWNSDNKTKTYATGLTRMTYDYTLEKLAMKRAEQIAIYFSHTNTDGSYATLNTMLNGGYTSAGENIAAGNSTARATMEQWKETNESYSGQGHRRNMLSGYNAIGIAHVKYMGMDFWVQEFGSTSKPDTAKTAATSGKTTAHQVIDNTLIDQTGQISGGSSVSLDTKTKTRATLTAPTIKNAHFEYGWTSFSATAEPIWHSANTKVARIEGNNVVAVATGTTSVYCYVLGKKVTVQVSVNMAPMYRLYNPYTGEHFYTANVQERDYLDSIGWNYEGLAWVAPAYSKTPVYRLYNPYTSDHFYTTNRKEYDFLQTVGWRGEGIGWYSDDGHHVAVYRLYNPYATVGTHLYTTDKKEYQYLGTIGWRREGIAWYGFK